MGCHLIALGGAGQKALEMISYACACDALYETDDDLRRVPLPALSVLTADTDLSFDSTAAQRYQALQTVFSAAAPPHAGFHTKLNLEHFAVVDPARPSVQDIARGREQLFTRTLFSAEKTALDAREGLQGQADLGMFFFADALSRLSETLAQGGEFPFFDRIQTELDQGEDVKVLLIGSVYGGTGMSGIQSFARFLRGRFAYERLSLGAALVLPPHDPKTVGLHNARAAAALRQYGADGLMRRSGYDDRGLLDAAYLIRMSGNLYAMNYAQAAESAPGDLRLADWLAARSASQFFAARLRGENAEGLGLYHLPRTSHQPAWPCFDDDRAFFRLRFGGLMRAAALHLSACEPELSAGLAGKSRLAPVFAPFYKAAKHFGAPEREALQLLQDALTEFFSQVVRRMNEIQRLQPAPMPGKAEPDGFFSVPALQALKTILTIPGGDAAEARRAARETLPALICGGTDPNFSWKRMLAQLQRSRRPVSDTPSAAFAAYAAALLNCAAQGTAGLPALQLPEPDSRGIDPNHHLLTLARNLPLLPDAPLCAGPDVLAWETRLSALLSLPHAQAVRLREVAQWRGLIAVLLLWDGWELRHNLPKLNCAPPPEGDGTRAVLAALSKERLNAGLTLFILEKDVDGVVFEGPLGLLSPHTGLLSAADPEKLYGLLPECARWYTPDTKTFADPCPLLSEPDRARLIHRLKCLQALTERAEPTSPLRLGGGALYAAADAFLGDLQNQHDLWRERFEADDPRAAKALYVRALAVFGPAVEGIERQEEELSLQDIRQNPLMIRLLGEPGELKRGAAPSALFDSEPMTTYFYHGTAFAVDSARYLLAPVNAEGEPQALQALEEVLDHAASPAYHRQAAKRFLELANRLTSRPGASKKAVSLLRAWSVKHSKLAETIG